MCIFEILRLEIKERLQVAGHDVSGFQEFYVEKDSVTGSMLSEINCIRVDWH